MNGPEDTPYEGGLFPCIMTFPSNYPNSPPQMRFTTPGFWHPNVYVDGRVCISILHEPREDIFNEAELMSEKWRPILSVEAILISVQSMLSTPNFSSPANVQASVELQRDPTAYRRKIRALVRRSLEEF
uniref:Ubiquitin-conjugating enzyme E2 7 n=2 Tax=Lygus hesperus TaxID=30085 RepID=A0A0A9XKJ6_LYGHE